MAEENPGCGVVGVELEGPLEVHDGLFVVRAEAVEVPDNEAGLRAILVNVDRIVREKREP